MPTDARERLIVALDVPNAADARNLVSQLDGLVSFFKVGLELFTAAGPELVRTLIRDGKRVFLDLKFLDIEETVKRAVQQAASLGASFTTVHESGNVAAAAVEGARGTELKILAVTVLTSMDDAQLKAMGINWPVQELVLHRAKRAVAAGCHGVVASGQEARQIRSLSKDLIIVTPGIRPAGADAHEQKRATTPTEAIEAGSDYLVVGRPINRAASPRNAATAILQEMQQAFDSSGR
ncbi:MAG: orotidine-5'-phosphate decarboxylase [Acidobacteria bacterium]|nr:orotidine-5'-phosphate decarboxylase [Acidobacteriota bacterium]